MLLVQLQAYRQEYSFDGIFLLPVNLSGPRDNFDPASSHVIPAMIRKFVEAREGGSSEVVLWGDGTPTRLRRGRCGRDPRCGREVLRARSGQYRVGRGDRDPGPRARHRGRDRLQRHDRLGPHEA